MTRRFRIPAVPYGQSVHPAPERVKTVRVTLNGKRQTVHLLAYGWETRNSWGHSAYCPETDQTSRIRYYNRTWEAERFDSVLADLLHKVRLTDARFARAERRKARERRKAAARAAIG